MRNAIKSKHKREKSGSSSGQTQTRDATNPVLGIRVGRLQGFYGARLGRDGATLLPLAAFQRRVSLTVGQITVAPEA